MSFFDAGRAISGMWFPDTITDFTTGRSATLEGDSYSVSHTKVKKINRVNKIERREMASIIFYPRELKETDGNCQSAA
jgi:hypothetical protein